MRSAHPQTSFAAVGRNAEVITAGHAFDSMMGESSPLARLEDLNAKVLLLGVGYDSCTAFHLAEYRIASTSRPRAQNSFAAMVNGKREWVTVEDVKLESDDFEQLGAEYETKHSVAVGVIGAAECRLFSLREAVAFAQEWFSRNRSNIQKS
jgi:aminoglycoside 3-N-acetyltransferase